MIPEQPADPVGTLDQAAPAPDRLPDAAWALGLVCLVGQLARLAEVGITDLDTWPVSSLLGALIVGWFANGVLTARTVRLWIVWFLFGILVPLQLLAVVHAGLEGLAGWPGVNLVLAVVQLAALAWFCRSDYFAWQRTRPAVPGPSRASLLAVAALVGVLGGVIAVPETGNGVGFHARFDVG